MYTHKLYKDIIFFVVRRYVLCKESLRIIFTVCVHSYNGVHNDDSNNNNKYFMKKNHPPLRV